ncbi:MAG TPA: hypothetical protein VK469_22925 [Candidatus Kapabacteria bacterium]|nr:hypothetical protein [Candidatus Kapabacteria bacterium]
MTFKRSSLTIVMVVFALLIGCSQAKNDKEQKDALAGKKTKKEKPGGVDIPRVFAAPKYSDGVWENGINKKNKNQFFITIDKAALNPLITGSKLKFASAGEVTVKQTVRQDNKSYANIFVTVDKDLDPVKDGNPNPIYIKSLDLQPSRYSDPGVWQNGINLVQPGLFFLTIRRMDQTPIKVGDRLKFAKSGPAKVIYVSRTDKSDKFADIFVKVDRSLDGIGDGFPNNITVMITD